MAPHGEVDPGCQDDQCLPDRQGADHGDLLQDQRLRAQRAEVRVQVVEHEERHDQQQERADRGVGVQQVLDALHWGVASLGELLRGGVGRCGRGCARTGGGGWCHDFLPGCRLGPLCRRGPEDRAPRATLLLV